MSDNQTGQTKAGFVHLHNHSHYSLLDGLQKVPAMLDRVKALGMTAIALTDHGTLSGTVEFYNEARKRDLKPIIGVEAYVAPRGLADKSGKADANPYHLILLAYNQTGYLNLMKLVSIAHLEGFYYRPRVDRELLAKHHEGLIALSGCAGGEVATHILNGDLGQAEAVVKWYSETFGPDNYYLEMQDHEEKWADQKKINQALKKLADQTGLPLVVTADSHYGNPEDREAHEILLCVQTGKTIGDTDRMTMEMDLFVSAPGDIAKRFKDCPQALANTVKIAERCQVEIEFGRNLLPKFDVPTGQTEQAYLHQLVFQGLAWRYGGIPREDISQITREKAIKLVDPVIVKRLDYELEVIATMAYDGYFLIVADFINWGKNQGIIFGPGRGSAAGSIVAYALNITDIDPLKYDLLFERFLNPDRISMPDIDVDMQDTRRDEVIAYVTEKYGHDRVAQIITFGTMAARAAVRDAGRALGMAYGDVDVVAKLVPMPVQGRHIPLAKSIKDDPDLAREYQASPKSRQLIDMAIKLEGTIRSNGVHAAGVVIAPDEIVNYTPLQRAQKGGVSTQYSMNPVEELGLLKMDLLGLSNLTIINNALRIIRKVYNRRIDIAQIPMDDPKTFTLLSRGETTGVFQLESAGMKRYLRELKPNQFEDIIAMVALYRPGPMAELPHYIEGKLNPEKVSYPHPSLEPILKPTYGVMVFQEQIIALLQLIAGYSPGQADLVRKAIGKKKRDIMTKEHPNFLKGCIAKGLTKEKAESLWNLIQPFADYSFNKAHAACYGLIAYQTAYLKAQHPAALMAALMTSDYGNIERIAIEVAECLHLGIEVLPPDVNESFLEFGVVPETGAIRFGLSAIKNVGSGAIEAILKAREDGGRFSSVEDFAVRVNAAEMNRKVWESLAKVGAFDNLTERGTLLHNLDTVIDYAAKAQKNALSGQIDIFGSLGVEDALPGLRLDPPATALTNREQLAWEKELMGLYLSSHPLDNYEAYLAGETTPLAELSLDQEGQTVTVGGIITTVRRIITRNQSAMCFAGLEDKAGQVELIVFPKIFESTSDIWQTDQVIKVKGKVSTKDREGRSGSEIKLIVDSAELIDYDQANRYQPRPTSPDGPAETPASLVITLHDISNTALLMQIKDLLGRHSGDAEVFVVVTGDQPKKIRLPLRVAVSDALIERLGKLLGEGKAVRQEA